MNELRLEMRPLSCICALYGTSSKSPLARGTYISAAREFALPRIASAGEFIRQRFSKAKRVVARIQHGITNEDRPRSTVARRVISVICVKT